MLFTCFHPCNYFLLEEDASTIVFEKDSTALNKSLKTKNSNNNLKFLTIVLTISVESDWGPIWSSLIKKKIYWHDSIHSWRKTCRYEDISDILKPDTLSITCLSSLLFSVCIFILSVLDRSVLRCSIHTTLTTGKRDIPHPLHMHVYTIPPTPTHRHDSSSWKSRGMIAIVLSWVIMPVLGPMSWIYFTNIPTWVTWLPLGLGTRFYYQKEGKGLLGR